MTHIRPLSVVAVLTALAVWLGALVSAQPEPRLLLYRVGRLPFAEPMTSVAVAGRHAYVTSKGTLVVVDVDDPTRPRIVARVSTPGEAHEVVLDGTTALVADGSGGLRLVDVSRPDAPLPMGRIALDGPVTDVAAAGGLAVVAHSKQVDVVDYGDPDAPRVVSTIPLDHDVSDVALQGDLALVTVVGNRWGDEELDLQLFDVADPRQPVAVGSLPLFASTLLITVYGKHAFLGHYVDGNLLADTPGPPVTCEPGPCTPTVVYQAMPQRTLPPSQGVLTVVDIEDPHHPILSDKQVAGGPIGAVAVHGARVYSAGDFDGEGAQLLGFEVSDQGTLRPLWTRYHDSFYGPHASGIAVAEGLLYLVTQNDGLLILAVASDGAPSPTVRPRSTSTPEPTPRPPLFVPSAER